MFFDDKISCRFSSTSQEQRNTYLCRQGQACPKLGFLVPPLMTLVGPGFPVVQQAQCALAAMRRAGTIILVRIVGSTGKRMLGVGTSDMMISLSHASGKTLLRNRDKNLRRKKGKKICSFHIK